MIYLSEERASTRQDCGAARVFIGEKEAAGQAVVEVTEFPADLDSALSQQEYYEHVLSRLMPSQIVRSLHEQIGPGDLHFVLRNGGGEPSAHTLSAWLEAHGYITKVISA